MSILSKLSSVHVGYAFAGGETTPKRSAAPSSEKKAETSMMSVLIAFVSASPCELSEVSS
eukprot:3807368-Pleurochrysis_carterae.AAC.1